MKTLLNVFAACLLLITGAWTVGAQQNPQQRTLSYADKSVAVGDLLGNSIEVSDMGGQLKMRLPSRTRT